MISGKFIKNNNLSNKNINNYSSNIKSNNNRNFVIEKPNYFDNKDNYFNYYHHYGGDSEYGDDELFLAFKNIQLKSNKLIKYNIKFSSISSLISIELIPSGLLLSPLISTTSIPTTSSILSTLSSSLLEKIIIKKLSTIILLLIQYSKDNFYEQVNFKGGGINKNYNINNIIKLYLKKLFIILLLLLFINNNYNKYIIMKQKFELEEYLDKIIVWRTKPEPGD